MAETYDVIVVGLGGIGSAAAYHLARRGQRVLGLERFTAAHDRGHPDALDRAVTPAEVEDIAAAIRARVPALAGRFLRAAPCMYTNTPDDHFVVGPHPRHPQVVVAAGFCGHGFKFAPVMGEIVADLTVEGRTAHPIGLFDPLRF